METFNIKFDNILNLTDGDVDKFWKIINDTKYVNRTVENDGAVIFNLIIQDPNQQRSEDIKLTLYCSRFLLKENAP